MNIAINQEILNDILGGVETLAKKTFGSTADSAKKDAQAFLDSIQADLSAWTQQLAQGQISAEDLKWQVESKKDLGQMMLLQKAGIAQIKIDDFRNGLINIICSTVLSKIGLA